MNDQDRLAEIKARMEAAFATPTTGPQRDAWMRWIDTMREDVPWLVGEVERLRERLRGFEGYRAYSTCRICGEPIERFRNIWYHETTRDHDAEPTAEIRST